MASGAERVSEVLRLVAASPNGTTCAEVASTLKMSRAAASRLLGLLIQNSLVERDGETERYNVALDLWPIGAAAVHRHNLLELTLRPLADACLRFHVGFTLGVRKGLEVYHIHRIEPVHGSVVVSPVSGHLPVNISSIGKAILAFESDDLIEEVIRADMPRATARSKAGEDLRRDLAAIRARGYSTNWGESQLQAVSIGAPIFNRYGQPIAAVACHPEPGEPKDPEHPEEFEKKAVPTILAATEMASRSLGYSSIVRSELT